MKKKKKEENNPFKYKLITETIAGGIGTLVSGIINYFGEVEKKELYEPNKFSRKMMKILKKFLV